MQGRRGLAMKNSWQMETHLNHRLMEVAVSVVAASEINVGTQYCRFENNGTMSAFLDVIDVED